MMKQSDSASHPALDASATYDELDTLFKQSFIDLDNETYVRPLLETMGEHYRSWLTDAGITVTRKGLIYIRPVFRTAFVRKVEDEMTEIGMEVSTNWDADGNPVTEPVKRMCAFVGLLFALNDCGFCERAAYPWEDD